MMHDAPTASAIPPQSLRATRRPAASALLVALSAVLALWAGAPAQARQERELPTDPALVEGALANGLRYLVRPTGEGDPVVIRIVIPAGAIHEPAEARGVAEVVHHLANLRPDEPGALDAESPPPGIEAHGYITLDAAHYIVRIANPTPDRLDDALRLLAQPLDARSFREADLLRERRAAEARLTQFDTPDARVQRELLRRLRLGQVADRLPAPGIDVEALSLDAAEAFHRARYGAGSASVVCVGGVNPDDVAQRIGDAFGALPGTVAPDLEWSPTPYDAPFAAVVAEADLADCDVDVVAIAPEPGPPATVQAFERELVRTVALRALARRLDASVSAGAPFDDGAAHVVDLVGLARLYNVFVSGPPDAWEPMLESLVAEIRRVRETGFDPVEIERAGDEVLAELRRAQMQDRESGPERIAGRLAFSASSGRPPMSLDQRVDLTEAIVREMLAGDAADAVAEMFDPRRIAYAVSIPASAGADLDAERVLAAARADEAVYAPATEAERLAGATIPEPPATGAVSTISLHEAAGVLSARLSNQVLVHHKRIDDAADRVHVTITLAGGRIEECADTRGLTDAAALALARPATGALSSAQVADLLAREGAELEARIIDDAITLRLESSPEALGRSLSLIYALLADARIEPAALDAWRRARLREARERSLQPFDALRDALPSVLFSADEARVRPLAPDEVKRITIERTEAWLARLLAESPIEVGIAGPIDRERAVMIAAATLGALPERRPIGPESLDHLRNAQPGERPFAADIVLESDSAQALLLLALIAPDEQDTRNAELLDIGAGALRQRLERLGRGRPGLVYPMTAFSRPARIYPGFGLTYAIAPVTGDRLEEFTELLEREWKAFLAGEIDDSLLRAARDGESRRAARRLSGAEDWADLLAARNYRDRDLDRELDAPARLASYTSDDVRDAIRRIGETAPGLRITIRAVCPGAEAPAERGAELARD
ncbi:MAG: M16 family metallopeptidase [Phycisphaerales bacterium]